MKVENIRKPTLSCINNKGFNPTFQHCAFIYMVIFKAESHSQCFHRINKQMKGIRKRRQTSKQTEINPEYIVQTVWRETSKHTQCNYRAKQKTGEQCDLLSYLSSLNIPQSLWLIEMCFKRYHVGISAHFSSLRLNQSTRESSKCYL